MPSVNVKKKISHSFRLTFKVQVNLAWMLLFVGDSIIMDFGISSGKLISKDFLIHQVRLDLQAGRRI